AFAELGQDNALAVDAYVARNPNAVPTADKVIEFLEGYGITVTAAETAAEGEEAEAAAPATGSRTFAEPVREAGQPNAQAHLTVPEWRAELRSKDPARVEKALRARDEGRVEGLATAGRR